MFWELYQQMQISNAQGVAERAANDAITAKNNITLLEDKIACLALACQSLWEIVEQETDITREQLLAKMEEVDLRDGKKDGKLSPVAENCNACGRRTSRRRSICIYCGNKNESNEIFGLR